MSLQQRLDIYARFGCLILSAEQAKAHKPEPGSVLIRIADCYFDQLKWGDLYVAILKSTFADIDFPQAYEEMMTEEQASEIAGFLRRHSHRKLVVHCHAGISRSSAVATAWARLHGNQALEDAIATSPIFYPNPHVLRLVTAALRIGTH